MTISSGEVGSIELGALGLESSQLASVLAKIPALGALPTGTLTTVIAGLPANSTLASLLSAIKSSTGVEVSTGEVTQVLLGDALTNPAVVSSLLADIAARVQGTPQAAQLAGVLANLLAGLTPSQLQQLESQLGASGSPAELASTLLGRLAHGELTSALSTVLGELGAMAPTTGAAVAQALGTAPGTLAGELGLGESALKSASGMSVPLGSGGGFFDILSSPGGLHGGHPARQ